MSVKLSTVIEDTNNKKPRYIFEDPVSMKSPTFNVLENSAKSSYDDFEPIAKQDVSSQKNNLIREKSSESLTNLVTEFNQKQVQPEKDKKKDYWGDFDALNNTDQIESIPDIL